MIKIAISGIGGVGGYYGGKLAAFYEHSDKIEICFISRGENLRVITEQGLQIHTPAGIQLAHPAIATDNPVEIGPVEYLFCCTKSYDLEDNINQLKPLIKAGTVIIPLLNGANISDRIQKQLPGNEVWMGCTYIGVRLAAPGIIKKFTEKDRLWFGHPTAPQQKQQKLLQLLTDAGIDALNPEDITTRIWKKFFLISLGATTTSYYNQCIGEVMDTHPESFRQLGKELKAVADAKGIVLPDDIIEKTICDQRMMPYESTTSMHTDFKNGKQAELETLTGYVVHAGQELGIPTPAYEMMYKKLQHKISHS